MCSLAGEIKENFRVQWPITVDCRGNKHKELRKTGCLLGHVQGCCIHGIPFAPPFKPSWSSVNSWSDPENLAP